jgi:predicted kinase
VCAGEVAGGRSWARQPPASDATLCHAQVQLVLAGPRAGRRPVVAAAWRTCGAGPGPLRSAICLEGGGAQEV